LVREGGEGGDGGGGAQEEMKEGELMNPMLSQEEQERIKKIAEENAKMQEAEEEKRIDQQVPIAQQEQA